MRCAGPNRKTGAGRSFVRTEKAAPRVGANRPKIRRRGIAAEQIEVVHNGMEHERYQLEDAPELAFTLRDARPFAIGHGASVNWQANGKGAEWVELD